MNKVYYKTDGAPFPVETAPDGPIYIECVEVRGQQLGLRDHTDTEVIITYRPAGGTEVKQDKNMLESFADAMRAARCQTPPPADLRENEDPRDTFGGQADTEDYAITMDERLRPRRY